MRNVGIAHCSHIFYRRLDNLRQFRAHKNGLSNVTGIYKMFCYRWQCTGRRFGTHFSRHIYPTVGHNFHPACLVDIGMKVGHLLVCIGEKDSHMCKVFQSRNVDPYSRYGIRNDTNRRDLGMFHGLRKDSVDKSLSFLYKALLQIRACIHICMIQWYFGKFHHFYTD